MTAFFRFRLWESLRRFGRESIHRRLALAFGGVSLLMMLGLAGLLLKQQQHILDQTSILRAKALANGLANSSSSWVLANDVVGLQEILQGYAQTPNLIRAFVLSPRGQVLASTRTNEIGLYVSDDLSQQLLSRQQPKTRLLLADRHMIDVAVPITVNAHLVGWARIELDQQATQANLRSVAVASLKFIVVTVVVLLLVSLWLSTSLIKPLQSLMRVASAIETGSRAERSQLEGNNEISQLGRSLNNMLDTLVRSEQQLDLLNRVYAAWTESVATIVRESDEYSLLTRICNILKEKIRLRLVFVGMLDASGQIKVLTHSDSEPGYVDKLHISVDPRSPYGQTVLARAIRQKQPCILNDLLGEPEAQFWHKLAREAGIQSVAAFPLLRNKHIIGGLAVYSEQTYFFSDSIITLLNGLVNDISYALDNFDRERQRTQAEIELTLAASVFENSQEGIMITDADKTIRRVNLMFSVLTGYSAEECIGKSPKQIACWPQQAALDLAVWDNADAEQCWQGEVDSCRKDGEHYPQWLSITKVINQQGHLTHYVVTFTDITERKLNEARIYKLAFYDPLTDLPNRRLLLEKLEAALIANQRKGGYGAVMFLDLDRFKILNDTQGHNLGDQLLIEAGKRLCRSVREVDMVARHGGDEFVVLLEELSANEQSAAINAQKIGNKILNEMNQVYCLHQVNPDGTTALVEHYSSASIGVAVFHGSGLSSEDLLNQADMAMYQAKQAGRNTLCMFDPQMQAGLNKRAALEAELRNGVERNQFKLFYQIQVDQWGRALGAEAMLRWQHPRRGIVEPREFIVLAEESGVIVGLGNWALLEACTTLATWARLPSMADLNLAVNISAKQLSQQNFVEQLQTMLSRTGANPKRLILEVTENEVLGSVENTIAIMQALKELGVGFSMDDFGTGYSSLTYLQRLPLTQLKIDRSFISGSSNVRDHDSIVRTILVLGQSLNLQIMAEGVETEQQLDYLISGGCQYFQGYLFGYPEPLAEFNARFNRQTS
ncbi:MAG: EAL domain-containing protein [Methylomonas sp.]|jgi:diguanylate cyclase (GGDEF)-like protein/PAS domain S-box-containing protein|uniref:EAL domain-containing protein n=1 Tax=Methylomonas sp. TaxID=418 RepID=UPI0025F67E83|nr:EAL domain-containing protein [Methylomonas sp.]MCK9606608.1 EAL domain-containing protein [Methylomonas sp.]